MNASTAVGRPVRVGAVSYLNSKPLIEDLAVLLPDAELSLDYPSRLTTALDAGLLDVALVPSVTGFLKPGYQVVSDACVAARGPVLSVKLFSRVPPETIRILALDAGSRTSSTLVQILLAERCHARPALQSLPLEASCEDTTADAVLLIGDRCMDPPREAFHTVWDLGEEWNRWTGLPFVFAMWVAREGALSDGQLDAIESGLTAARDRGLERLEAIARREAPRLGLPLETTLEYLSTNLYYRLGTAERAGLTKFHALAVRHQLVPKDIDLVFRECDYAA